MKNIVSIITIIFLIVGSLIPTVTSAEFYNISGTIYYDGDLEETIHIMAFKGNMNQGPLYIENIVTINSPGDYSLQVHNGKYYVVSFMNNTGINIIIELLNTDNPLIYSIPLGFAINESLFSQHIKAIDVCDGDAVDIDITLYEEPLMANFTWNPIEPIIDEIITFTDTSKGNITERIWYIENDILYGDTVVYDYSIPGIYDVKLTVINTNEMIDNITKSIEVFDVPNILPTAYFNFTPDNPKVNDDVQFTDNSTDPDGTIVSWEWNFGDGTTSTEQNPIHQYDTAGLHRVELNVTDNASGTDNITKVIIIDPEEEDEDEEDDEDEDDEDEDDEDEEEEEEDEEEEEEEEENSPPTYPITEGPTLGKSNVEYSFTVVSTDADQDNIQYVFNWGDGSKTTTSYLSSNEKVTKSHFWNTSGEYTIKITATDTMGNKATSEIKIIIEEEQQKQNDDENNIPLSLIVIVVVSSIIVIIKRDNIIKILRKYKK